MIQCRLSELAKKKDIKLARLAKEIGYRHNTLYTLADNKMKYVEIKLVLALCDFFDCEISDLFYLPNDHLKKSSQGKNIW